MYSSDSQTESSWSTSEPAGEAAVYKEDPALHKAAYMGDVNQVKKLLHSFDTNIRDSEGRTAAYYAASQGKDEVLRILIQNGGDLEYSDNEGMRPIHKAVFSSHVTTCKLLLEAKIDLTAADKQGRTPLHFAAFNGSLACGSLLIENGANINALDCEGRSPLHWAVYNGYHLFVEILLDKRADTELLDNGGRSPIIYAAYRGQKECFSLLLARGANTNVKDNEGKTIIDHAEANGHLDIIQLYKQFLSRSLPLDGSLSNDLSTSDLFMTPNSKLVLHNRSDFNYDSELDTDSSTEDDLLLSDLEIKKALSKHALIVEQNFSEPKATEQETFHANKRDRKEQRRKKEHDTLEQLIETTQEMEEALKSLEQQNEDLNEQLMEKEILLNLAQKELEAIKNELLKQETEEKAELKRNGIQLKQHLSEYKAKLGINVHNSMPNLVAALTKEKEDIENQFLIEKQSRLQLQDEKNSLLREDADLTKVETNLREQVKAFRVLEDKYNKLLSEYQATKAELEKTSNDSKNELNLLKQEKYSMMEVHRKQLEEAQNKLENMRLENRESKQIFAREHNSIVNEVARDKDYGLKMEEMLQNERETHKKVMKTMESNIENKSKQVSKLMSELDEFRNEARASHIKIDEISQKLEEVEREKDKWRSKYQAVLKETEDTRLTDTYGTALNGQAISMLREKAEQGSIWENEANLWKHKYTELQQTLVMFNLNIEKASGVGKDVDLLIHDLSSEIDDKNKHIETLKGGLEDLHLQLSTEREVSQRFQLQYEKEVSRAKIASEEFYSKIKDLQANVQHYKHKSRNMKIQYEEQVLDLKKQLEAISAKFKEYCEKSEVKQRELLDRLSRYKSPLPPEERSHQILRSTKALQDKIQELAQEKLEHNATKQQMRELKEQIILSTQEPPNKKNQPPLTPQHQYSNLYAAIMEKEASLGTPTKEHQYVSTTPTSLQNNLMSTPENRKLNSESEILRMNEDLESLVSTVEQLKSRLNFLDKQVS